MRRAYLLIALPALLVGIGYFVLFRAMGVQLSIEPFIGALALIVLAVWVVRYLQRRKVRREESSSLRSTPH